MMFPKIYKTKIKTLQVNIGYKCNQACSHCHVDASPLRTEMMSDKNISLIPRILEKLQLNTLDITGGAPELHPKFRELVYSARSLGVEVVDRCNLTILDEPGQEELGEFLLENKVRIIASLPCYLQENVDQQRGNGVFIKSIKALKKLNALGYGDENTKLKLDLVYNPQGPKLPPNQNELEKLYRLELKKRYGVSFTSLLTITNMPIKRFADQLIRTGKFDLYQRMLLNNFNEKTLDNLMCKDQISVDWAGNLYDCDFNQMLGLHMKGTINKLSDLLENKLSLNNREIEVGSHCFGCTAGSGSSCGGSLT